MLRVPFSRPPFGSANDWRWWRGDRAVFGASFRRRSLRSRGSSPPAIVSPFLVLRVRLLVPGCLPFLGGSWFWLVALVVLPDLSALCRRHPLMGRVDSFPARGGSSVVWRFCG